MKKILTILAVMAVFVASFAAKAQDRTCKTDSICGREIVKSAMKYLGSPYRSGHMSPKSGFDCSGFTTFIFSTEHLASALIAFTVFSTPRRLSSQRPPRPEGWRLGVLLWLSRLKKQRRTRGHCVIGRRIGQLQVYPLKLFTRRHGIVVTGSLLRKALHRRMPCG